MRRAPGPKRRAIARRSAPLTSRRPQRLLLVGAFAYPHHQGSQVYFQEQAIALRAAGCEVDLLTYASAGPDDGDPDRWRALDGFALRRGPAWTAPSRISSGPSLGKPLADLAMTRDLNDAIESKTETGASYDAILTHHLESCVIAMTRRLARPESTPPILYCVHTLLAHELSAYSKCLKMDSISPYGVAPRGWRQRVKRVIDRTGAYADGFAGRRADGWLALTRESSRVMRQHSSRPGDRIPPPVPDPRHAFDAGRSDDVARAHGLEPGRYLLYSGNLDAYQELDLLARAQAAIGPEERPRVVLATHDRSPRPGSVPDGCEVVPVRDAGAMRGLLAGARATLVARRAPGGFPIKLANGLAAGTAPIVFHDAEWGLRDDVDCVLATGRDPLAGLVAALRRAETDPDGMARIGVAARSTWARAHQPQVVAEATLALIERVIERAESPARP